MSTQTGAPPTGQPTTYHYILTVQKDTGLIGCRAGLWTAPVAGARRDEALQQITTHHFPDQWPGLVVLYFSLELNQL